MPVISIFALFGLIIGIGAERKNLIQPKLARLISQVLVQFFYPCLVFASLLSKFQAKELAELWLLPLFVFFLLLVGLSFGLLTKKLSGVDSPKAERSYVFLSSMPNYSFLPMVLAQSFWGEEGLGYIAVAGVGADLFLWTLAFPQISGQRSWRKVFSPALLSVLLALLVQFVWPLRGEAWSQGLFLVGCVGKVTLPLSMFVLGRQLARTPFHIPIGERKAQALIALFRLILCPFLAFILLEFYAIDLPQLAKACLLLALSMPPAIVTVVLSELYGADSQFAARSIFWGHILGIVTVSAWMGFYLT